MKPHWIQTYRFIEDLALQKHSFRSGRMEKDRTTEQIYGVGRNQRFRPTPESWIPRGGSP